jgi:hypothetical protein
MEELVIPPLGVAEGRVCLRQHPGQRVVEVVISGELPDVLLSLLRLEHSQEHVDRHLLVSV